MLRIRILTGVLWKNYACPLRKSTLVRNNHRRRLHCPLPNSSGPPQQQKEVATSDDEENSVLAEYINLAHAQLQRRRRRRNEADVEHGLAELQEVLDLVQTIVFEEYPTRRKTRRQSGRSGERGRGDVGGMNEKGVEGKDDGGFDDDDDDDNEAPTPTIVEYKMVPESYLQSTTTSSSSSRSSSVVVIIVVVVVVFRCR